MATAAHVMPWCVSHAMHQHLIEIFRNVTEGGHDILIMDPAECHLSHNLAVPENAAVLPVSPKAPELNPVDNSWQFTRDDWLSNRVFGSSEDIVNQCCYAGRSCRSADGNGGKGSDQGRLV